MFTPTLRCECAQPASDRLMRKWCIWEAIPIRVQVFKLHHYILHGVPLTLKNEVKEGIHCLILDLSHHMTS